MVSAAPPQEMTCCLRSLTENITSHQNCLSKWSTDPISCPPTLPSSTVISSLLVQSVFQVHFHVIGVLMDIDALMTPLRIVGMTFWSLGSKGLGQVSDLDLISVPGSMRPLEAVQRFWCRLELINRLRFVL